MSPRRSAPRRARLVLTSGATEANNLAIKGAARIAAARGGSGRRRIVTLATEHKMRAGEREGPRGPRASSRSSCRWTAAGLLDPDVLRAGGGRAHACWFPRWR